MVIVTDRMDAKETYASELRDKISYAKQVTVPNTIDCPQKIMSSLSISLANSRFVDWSFLKKLIVKKRFVSQSNFRSTNGSWYMV